MTRQASATGCKGRTARRDRWGFGFFLAPRTTWRRAGSAAADAASAGNAPRLYRAGASRAGAARRVLLWTPARPAAVGVGREVLCSPADARGLRMAALPLDVGSHASHGEKKFSAESSAVNQRAEGKMRRPRQCKSELRENAPDASPLHRTHEGACTQQLRSMAARNHRAARTWARGHGTRV